MRADLIEKQLSNPDKFGFFVPPKAHWSKIKHLKESVGSGLNKALAAIEDANAGTLENVLKGINFNRRVGQRTMDDSTLVEFIQHFDEIPLSNDDFEFPDLLGAAYESLIKYFDRQRGNQRRPRCDSAISKLTSALDTCRQRLSETEQEIEAVHEERRQFIEEA